MTAAACAALGLTEGPVHAELRVNDAGPWVIEVAARSIGGLCSRTLRFGTGMTLEEIILRHALGWPLPVAGPRAAAAGVMMIPIPRAGRLHGVRGLEAARAVRRHRGRHHHRPPGTGAGPAARGLAVSRLHLRPGRDAGGRRGGAARRARGAWLRRRLHGAEGVDRPRFRPGTSPAMADSRR